MKKSICIFTAVAMAMSMSFASLAATNVTVDDIVNNDSRVYMSGTEMVGIKLDEDGDGIRKDIVDVVSKTTRSSTGYSLVANKDSFGNVAYFRRAQLQTVVNRANWANEFAKERAREIVHDGMTKDEAMISIMVYLVSNYKYNRTITETDNRTQCNASDAYYLFNEGSGSYTAFSCAFRALAEEIPFTDGVVNWNAEDATYIKTALVENNSYMWNAVQFDDGTWLFYDAATAAENGVSPTTCEFTSGDLYDRHGEKIWHH